MLTDAQITSIKNQIECAAQAHLQATDADTALSHYTGDAVAVSNTVVFASKEALASDVRGYYASLKRVDHARWEDIHIAVVSESAATFTARFDYAFTNTEDVSIKLAGIWTALFVLIDGAWKIKLRHESFVVS